MSGLIGISLASASRRHDTARSRLSNDGDLANARDRIIEHYSGKAPENRKKVGLTLLLVACISRRHDAAVRRSKEDRSFRDLIGQVIDHYHE